MMAELVLAVALQASPPSTARPAVRATAPKPVPTRASKAASAAQKPKRSIARVVIDAGHGGVDPGAPIMTKGNVREKDIALQVALKVGNALKLKGIDVVYTRTKDTLIALADRGHIANQADGDVFISIHVNAANQNWKNPGSARGFETFFLAEARTEDARRVEAMENESMRFETGPSRDSSDPLSVILRDMEQNQYLRESADFADVMQRGLGRVHPGPDRGVKQAGFNVLVTALMPAILIELGFGTNSVEAAYLASPARQGNLARVIADATAEYLQRYQRRVGEPLGSHE